MPFRDRMLTIFTTCTPFTGERIRTQRNGILSWHNLVPSPEILIMGGREEGVQAFAEENNIKIVDVEYNEHNMPYFDSMFEMAQKEAKYDVLCFTNSDIIHFQCLMEAVKILKDSGFKEYVCTGQRYDLDIDFDLDKGIDVDEKIYKKLKGIELTSPSAGDYFIFPKSLDWSHMPHFIYGIPNCDTWLNADTLERGIPLIDATHDVILVHQKHGKPWKVNNPDFDRQHQYNIRLAGPKSVGCDVATYALIDGKIRDKWERYLWING